MVNSYEFNSFLDCKNCIFGDFYVINFVKTVIEDILTFFFDIVTLNNSRFRSAFNQI